MNSISNTFRYYTFKLYPYALLYFLLQNFLRICFAYIEYNELNLSLSESLELFIRGFIFDTITFLYISCPLILYLTFVPAKSKHVYFPIIVINLLLFATIYLLFFNAVAEYLFWNEFNVRFNFIAIDYLVYTQEVIANIYESYPIIWLLLTITLISSILTYLIIKLTYNTNIPVIKSRLLIFAIYIVLCFASLGVSQNFAAFSTNEHANEITKNGIYSLFSAFRNNDLPYSKFYLNSYQNISIPDLKTLISRDNGNIKLINKESDDITRVVGNSHPEKRLNVIIVVIESMSANFMQRFGNHDNITPNLDKLSKEALFFTNMFATGTRTVRGLEAITLSIPPVPGHSIIKRPNNENLYSIGFIFKERGYEVKFIYGGYGYFDNMNYFFANNGFTTIDRLNFSESEQTFSNAWGLCDEDLFNKVIKEANNSYLNAKPFMHMVMTTSNHRPYTFPKSKIDLASDGTGRRNAGVKYSDYAVGEFIKKASQQKWFDNTIFVFIADHTAGSAGKNELTVERYHIPLIIYAPKILKSKEISTLISQIDLAPTLLGILNFNYKSRFYGKDVLNSNNNYQHAFIATYQKLGYLTKKNLTILKPIKSFSQYTLNGDLIDSINPNELSLSEAISYYRHANTWKVNSAYIRTTINNDN